MAIEEIEKLTGFNRVMAYRFHHDESGNVVAEKCHPDLEPYVGRRYPAGYIPAQAGRLYTINTLRLIANVCYKPVSILPVEEEPPLDMRYCVLRSASPIHIEYL